MAACTSCMARLGAGKYTPTSTMQAEMQRTLYEEFQRREHVRKVGTRKPDTELLVPYLLVLGGTLADVHTRAHTAILRVCFCAHVVFMCLYRSRSCRRCPA